MPVHTRSYTISLFGFPPRHQRLLDTAVRRVLDDRRICARAAINCILISNAAIKALNRRYRKVNRVTDVISFLVDSRVERGACALAGDIYIARGRSQKQAAACGHAWERELAYLVMHGTLHLLGYTDYTPQEKKKMFAVQDALWEQLPC